MSIQQQISGAMSDNMFKVGRPLSVITKSRIATVGIVTTAVATTIYLSSPRLQSAVAKLKRAATEDLALRSTANSDQPERTFKDLDAQVEGMHRNTEDPNAQLLSALVTAAQAKFPLNPTPAAEGESYTACYAVTVKYLSSVLDEWAEIAKRARNAIAAEAGPDWPVMFPGTRRMLLQAKLDEELGDVPAKVCDMRRNERLRMVRMAAAYSFLPANDMIVDEALLRSRHSHERRQKLKHGRYSYWFNWLINSGLAKWWRGERQVHHFTAR